MGKTKKTCHESRRTGRGSSQGTPEHESDVLLSSEAVLSSLLGPRDSTPTTTAGHAETKTRVSVLFTGKPQGGFSGCVPTNREERKDYSFLADRGGRAV
jgi:hypothetical protein